jgi:hypothetical protein
VYLLALPGDSSPLLTDALLSVSGTTRIDEWSAKATYGQQFAVASRTTINHVNWTGIWYGGTIGWFKNQANVRNAAPTSGQIITPRAGLTTIPVYGRAYPEVAAYTTKVPVQSVVPLTYTIGTNQKYATTGLTPTDYYWAWNIDSSLPDDHTTIIGQDKYYEIQYNHRTAYVRAADVTVSAQ